MEIWGQAVHTGKLITAWQPGKCMRLVVVQKINILLISDLASFFSKATSKFKCASHIYLKRDFKTRGLPGFTDCYFQVSVCTRFLPRKAQLIPSSCRWSENRAIITNSVFL